ncbi:MAG: hypothetical protein HYX48_08415 [Chlamydiales bacterium]|nr:hypothetical protein [Chlamydiales bacterium]
MTSIAASPPVSTAGKGVKRKREEEDEGSMPSAKRGRVEVRPLSTKSKKETPELLLKTFKTSATASRLFEVASMVQKRISSLPLMVEFIPDGEFPFSGRYTFSTGTIGILSSESFEMKLGVLLFELVNVCQRREIEALYNEIDQGLILDGTAFAMKVEAIEYNNIKIAAAITEMCRKEGLSIGWLFGEELVPFEEHWKTQCASGHAQLYIDMFNRHLAAQKAAIEPA